MSETTEPLAGLEARYAALRQAARSESGDPGDVLAVQLRAVCLRAVLNQPETVLPADGKDQVKVGRLAIEMHRDDRFGAWRDSLQHHVRG